VVALGALAVPALAGQQIEKRTVAREGHLTGAKAPQLTVQRTAIRDDGSQVVEIRFEGTGIAALGTWLDFPVVQPVQERVVAVQPGLDGRYQVVSRVESSAGHLQVRLGALEVQVPFEGIPSGSLLATVVLPPAVEVDSASVIREKTSAADFRAKDLPMQVFLAEDDGPSARDLVAQYASQKSVPSIRGTTTAPGIDFEIVDPSDGDNGFCVTPGGSFTADVVMRPGSDTTTTCSQSCGTVNGGSGRLATAVLDIAFDTSKLSLASATKVDYPDGLIQDNSSSGRIGWAAAGDWNPDGDTTGTLASPCAMSKIETEITPMQLTFNVDGGFTSGSTTLHFRRSADGFAFSAADACANGFDESSGFDEIVDAVVGIDVTVDNTASSLAASPTTIPITTGTSTITATLSDGTNPLPGQVVRVELIGPNYSGATLSGVTDNGDGTYSDTLSAGANPGRVKVRYYVDKCSGTWQDDLSEDKVIIINDSAMGCDAADANGDTILAPADATAIMLEWSDGDANDQPTVWPTAGSYTSSTPCADANGDGVLAPADATALMLMWSNGM
jgi:hypothetical protein